MEETRALLLGSAAGVSVSLCTCAARARSGEAVLRSLAVRENLSTPALCAWPLLSPVVPSHFEQELPWEEWAKTGTRLPHGTLSEAPTCLKI